MNSPTSPRIDAHHHFWRYNPAEYDWIDDNMAAIRRDFLPDELAAEIEAAGIDGVVSVQARQTLHETNWLTELALQHDFVRGVVGWAPLADPDVAQTLEGLAAVPSLKGLRHVLQAERDDRYMLGEEFNAGVALLADLGLVYDILILERHLPYAIEFVDRHPGQTFVVDHIAKPRIRDGEIHPWAEQLTDLARRPNVYCKLSGLVTEADWESWTPDKLRPYMEMALEAFGPRRLMFGTDWPVCLVACEYGRWFGIVSEFAGELSVDGQSLIMGGTAIEAYKL